MADHICAPDLKGHVSKNDLKRTREVDDGKPDDYSMTCMMDEMIDVDDLSGANFYGADLRNTRWRVGIKLRGAKLRDVKLQEARLTKADLQQVVLVNADLSRAQLDDTDLSGADLSGANLSGTNLSRAKLDGANLSGANLNRTNLSSARLARANLHGCRMYDADFNQASFDETAMEYTGFGGPILQERNKDYPAAKEIYRNLRLNFRSIGEDDSLSWAYFHEREMQRKMSAPLSAFRYHAYEFVPTNQWARLKLVTKHDLRFIFWSLQAWSSGYGQRPLRALRTVIFLIPFFAILYALIGGVAAQNRVLYLQDYVLFSASTLLHVDTGDVKALTGIAQWLVNTEAVIGLGLFAIFANALGQRAGND